MQQEAQVLGNDILDAQAALGKIIREMPKASNDRGNQYKVAESEPRTLPKANQISEIGITKQRGYEYQSMAEHPEIVEQITAPQRTQERRNRTR